MRPASSYQSPSMTPPELPPIGDGQCEAKGCLEYNVEDEELCLEHLRERGDEMRADLMIDEQKYDRPEYGQYETDGKGSY